MTHKLVLTSRLTGVEIDPTTSTWAELQTLAENKASGSNKLASSLDSFNIKRETMARMPA